MWSLLSIVHNNREVQVSDDEIRAYIRERGPDAHWSGWGPWPRLGWEQACQELILIHNLVSNRYDNKDREILIKIIRDFAKGKVKHVILACTDLQLLMPQDSKIKIYDTIKILADATVKNING